MKSRIVYQLVAYRPETGELVFERDIPERFVRYVRQIAGVPGSDPDMLGSYPVDSRNVRDLAAFVGVDSLPTDFDYFIEPYADGAAATNSHRL